MQSSYGQPSPATHHGPSTYRTALPSNYDQQQSYGPASFVAGYGDKQQ